MKGKEQQRRRILCQDSASKICRILNNLGINSCLSLSKSPSVYVIINIDISRKPIKTHAKIRISDHAMVKGRADYNVWCSEEFSRFTGSGDWESAVFWVAKLAKLDYKKVQHAIDFEKGCYV